MSVKRTCNRHRDCDAADREFKLQYPRGKTVNYGLYQVTHETPSHCISDDCEDCFGS